MRRLSVCSHWRPSSPPRCSPGGAGRRGASAWTSTTTTARWSRWTGARPSLSGCSPSPAARSAALARDAGRSPRRRFADTLCSRGTSSFARARRSRWYLDKYRFETRPDLLARARGGARRRGRGARARRRPARRARSSAPSRWPQRPRSSSGPAVPDRAQRGQGRTAPRTGSRASSSRASASVSWRTSSPPEALRSRRSRRSARGRARLPDGRLCGRSRGGRSGRARAPRGASAPSVQGRRVARDGKKCRKPASLSGNRWAGRVFAGLVRRQGGEERDEAGVR